MINALKHRTKEAIIKLSNEVTSLGDTDIKSNHVKLINMINRHTQELREIIHEINKYKDQCL